jgi:hypothetical protein
MSSLDDEGDGKAGDVVDAAAFSCCRRASRSSADDMSRSFKPGGETKQKGGLTQSFLKLLDLGTSSQDLGSFPLRGILAGLARLDAAVAQRPRAVTF